MKNRIFTLLLLMVCSAAMAQQDPQFTQYVFNLGYINPSYVGSREEAVVNAFYRNQWTGVKGAPRTMSVSVDGSTAENRVGLGLTVDVDKIGAQNRSSLYGNYAYKIPFDNDATLALGIGAGFVQNGIDGTMLNPLDVDDPYLLEGKQNSISFDARAGIFYSKEEFFIGFSTDNLVASKTKKTKTILKGYSPRAHYYLTGGALVPLNETVYLKPMFLLKDDAGGPTSFDLNAFFLFNETIWVGGGYRTGVSLYPKKHLQSDLAKRSSFSGMVDVFATPKFRIGYAYDYALNALQGYNNGTHEISVTFYFGSDDNPLLKQIRCYRF